jgi:hypothetical protein
VGRWGCEVSFTGGPRLGGVMASLSVRDWEMCILRPACLPWFGWRSGAEDV